MYPTTTGINVAYYTSQLQLIPSTVIQPPSMAAPQSNPLALRLWRLAEAAPAALRTVHIVRARNAPRFNNAGKHRHAIPTAIVCLAGVARIYTARGALDLHPGSLAVIAPGAWHVHVHERSSFYTQGLSFGRSDIYFRSNGPIAFFLIPAQPSERIFKDILATNDSERLLQLGAELMTQATASAAQEVHYPRAVRLMAQRLWNGLGQPMRAEQVLAMSTLSPSQALRLFRAWFGSGPKQVMRARQLALAESLLNEGMSIDTVITEIGMPDRRSFNRAWRLAYGMSPPRSRG